jgi:hypothetical protein
MFSGRTRDHVEQGGSKAASNCVFLMEMVELIMTTEQGFITQGTDRS